MTTPYLIAARQGIILWVTLTLNSGRGCLRRHRGRTRSAVAMTKLGVSDSFLPSEHEMERWRS